MSVTSNARKLRQLLTADHPTKWLVFALIGSCIWLWTAAGYPSIVWSVGTALVAVAFLWLRLGGAIREDLRRTSKSQGNPSKRKQNFFRLLGTMTLFPLVFTLWFVPQTGLFLLAVLVILAMVPLWLLPGDLLPRGWLTKRWSRRKKRAAHR
jgi:hypothetical protein